MQKVLSFLNIAPKPEIIDLVAGLLNYKEGVEARSGECIYLQTVIEVITELAPDIRTAEEIEAGIDNKTLLRDVVIALENTVSSIQSPGKPLKQTQTSLRGQCIRELRSTTHATSFIVYEERERPECPIITLVETDVDGTQTKLAQVYNPVIRTDALFVNRGKRNHDKAIQKADDLQESLPEILAETTFVSVEAMELFVKSTTTPKDTHLTINNQKIGNCGVKNLESAIYLLLLHPNPTASEKEKSPEHSYKKGKEDVVGTLKEAVAKRLIEKAGAKPEETKCWTSYQENKRFRKALQEGTLGGEEIQKLIPSKDRIDCTSLKALAQSKIPELAERAEETSRVLDAIKKLNTLEAPLDSLSNIISKIEGYDLILESGTVPKKELMESAIENATTLEKLETLSKRLHNYQDHPITKLSKHEHTGLKIKLELAKHSMKQQVQEESPQIQPLTQEPVSSEVIEPARKRRPRRLPSIFQLCSSERSVRVLDTGTIKAIAERVPVPAIPSQSALEKALDLTVSLGDALVKYPEEHLQILCMLIDEGNVKDTHIQHLKQCLKLNLPNQILPELKKIRNYLKDYASEQNDYSLLYTIQNIEIQLFEIQVELSVSQKEELVSLYRDQLDTIHKLFENEFKEMEYSKAHAFILESQDICSKIEGIKTDTDEQDDRNTLFGRYVSTTKNKSTPQEFRDLEIQWGKTLFALDPTGERLVKAIKCFDLTAGASQSQARVTRRFLTVFTEQTDYSKFSESCLEKSIHTCIRATGQQKNLDISQGNIKFKEMYMKFIVGDGSEGPSFEKGKKLLEEIQSALNEFKNVYKAWEPLYSTYQKLGVCIFNSSLKSEHAKRSQKETTQAVFFNELSSLLAQSCTKEHSLFRISAYSGRIQIYLCADPKYLILALLEEPNKPTEQEEDILVKTLKLKDKKDLYSPETQTLINELTLEDIMKLQNDLLLCAATTAVEAIEKAKEGSCNLSEICQANTMKAILLPLLVYQETCTATQATPDDSLHTLTEWAQEILLHQAKSVCSSSGMKRNQAINQVNLSLFLQLTSRSFNSESPEERAELRTILKAFHMEMRGSGDTPHHVNLLYTASATDRFYTKKAYTVLTELLYHSEVSEMEDALSSLLPILDKEVLQLKNSDTITEKEKLNAVALKILKHTLQDFTCDKKSLKALKQAKSILIILGLEHIFKVAVQETIKKLVETTLDSTLSTEIINVAIEKLNALANLEETLRDDIQAQIARLKFAYLKQELSTPQTTQFQIGSTGITSRKDAFIEMAKQLIIIKSSKTCEEHHNRVSQEFSQLLEADFSETIKISEELSEENLADQMGELSTLESHIEKLPLVELKMREKLPELAKVSEAHQKLSTHVQRVKQAHKTIHKVAEKLARKVISKGIEGFMPTKRTEISTVDPSITSTEEPPLEEPEEDGIQTIQLPEEDPGEKSEDPIPAAAWKRQTKKESEELEPDEDTSIKPRVEIGENKELEPDEGTDIKPRVPDIQKVMVRKRTEISTLEETMREIKKTKGMLHSNGLKTALIKQLTRQLELAIKLIDKRLLEKPKKQSRVNLMVLRNSIVFELNTPYSKQLNRG